MDQKLNNDAASSHTTETIIDIDALEEPPTLDITSHTLTANLPQSIPVGNQNELLGCFAARPEDLILPGQDAWEDVINPTFDCVIGFGKSVPEIAAFIRHGEYGMDGFCNWTMACIEHLNVPTSVLKIRLDRVMQAMVHLYV